MAAPQRRGGSGCLCCLFTVIVIVAILVGAVTLLTYLVWRPGFVRATAVSATLSRFDLADGPSSGGRTLRYNLTVDIHLSNINGYRLNYDYAKAQASYDGGRFGYEPLEPFSQERKSERNLTVAFGGSSPVNDGNAVCTYRRERSEGFYFVKLGLYSKLSFKFSMTSNAHLKCKISCTLRLPVPNASTTPVTTRLGTTCDMDY